ncbi:MAG: cupin domain-containing protein, partial [Candidatus Aenigmarchaeota archaeon CG_4_10_14_0_8_um_filter_37_24]
VSYTENGIISKQLARKTTRDATLFCMGAGTEISEHTSTKEGFVFVIEGKGVFNLEGMNIAMLPGASIFMGKNAVHSIKAEKNTSFLLLLFNE